MGKVIHATYRFLMNWRPQVHGTYTEQAPYGTEDKEDPKARNKTKSKLHRLGGRR